MRAITVVLPHFCNLGMLAEHQAIWASYPAKVRARLHVIVVDDCSPSGFQPSPADVWIEGLASFRIYRLLQKKRWNWLACRNLGAAQATTEWILFTDIDHGLPLDTLVRLTNGPLNPRYAYRFGRVDAPHRWPYALSACRSYKSHPDTWLLTKALFFDERIGGYDERLSGCYGTSGEFKDRVLQTVDAHVVLPEVVIRYPREIIPDASTSPSVYTRKNDPINDAELIKRRHARAKVAGWKPLHGLIPCELVYTTTAAEAVAC